MSFNVNEFHEHMENLQNGISNVLANFNYEEGVVDEIEERGDISELYKEKLYESVRDARKNVSSRIEKLQDMDLPDRLYSKIQDIDTKLDSILLPLIRSNAIYYFGSDNGDFMEEKETLLGLLEETDALGEELSQQSKSSTTIPQKPQTKTSTTQPPVPKTAPDKEFDVFVSHASEDKEEFVKPLVEALKDCGIKAWYDNHEIEWGDSISKYINNGLSKSRYVIVVLSPNFIKQDKYWTETELGGAISKEINGQKVVLPILHNITIEELTATHSTLASRLAINSDKGIEHIVNKMKKLLNKSS